MAKDNQEAADILDSAINNGNPDMDTDTAPIDTSQTDKVVEEEINEEAIKIADDFDKRIDEEGVDDEDTPSEEKKEDKKGEEKDTAEKVSEEDTTEEDEADEDILSDDLLTRAVQSGLNLEEAKSFGSSKALETALSHIERVASKNDNTTEKVETKEEGYKPFELKQFELKFENEEDIDPEILESVKGINDHYKTQMEAMNTHIAEQLKAVTTQVQSVEGNISNQESLTFEKNFDSMVNEVESDYKTELGKGTGREIAKDSVQMTNRMNVINAMAAINKVRTDGGNKALPEKEAFNQALTMVFADKAKEITTKKTVSKLTKRSKQAIGTPSGQKGKLDPYDKAVEASVKFDAKIDSEES